MFEDRNINIKHKTIKMGFSGLYFGNFSNIIKSLVNFDTFENAEKCKKKEKKTVLKIDNKRKSEVYFPK